MTVTTEAAQLTEAHRTAQARLSATTVSQMLQIWPLLDPEDIDATFPRWASTAITLLRSLNQRSTALAAGYVTAHRALELPTVAPVRVAPFTLFQTRAVSQSLLVTGPATLRSALARGVQLEQAAEKAQAASARAASRHVVNGGRDTIQNHIDTDDLVIGQARATSGSPCSFCAMLASRGPVYSADSFGADEMFSGSGRIKVHDGCNCKPEPVYHRDGNWPAGGRRFQQLWNEVSQGQSAEEARLRFRRAIEGRPLDPQTATV